MLGSSHARILAAVCLSIVTCAASGAEATAAQSSGIFVERFDGTGNGRWTLASTNAKSPGVRFPAAEEKPGFHFVSQDVSSATAPWDVGTAAFELSFEIAMTYGNRAAWRFPGVCLAVCSALPGKATEEDVALCWSVHAQGPIASVRTGGMFDAEEKRRGVWHFADQSRSPRFVLNQGGAGGHDYSIQWPDKRLAATRLRFHLIRRDDRTVEFTAWHERGGDRPWWTGVWELPEELATVPLRYVVV
ncbi:MAG TPA: hypothetical protein VE890_10900, partial [Thermoguttaceae bacterium]|nr:hypothetical protein [Thermoguttaceae bacterium]